MGTIITEQNTGLTYQQMQAVEFWIRGRRKNKAKALRLAGYSEAVVNQPHKVFGSPKVQRLLELRGHGKEGILNNQEPRVEIKEEVRQAPNIDFSSLSKEDLRTLKEKLGDISYKGNQVTQSNISSRPLPSNGSMEGAFDVSKKYYTGLDYKDTNFSSM